MEETTLSRRLPFAISDNKQSNKAFKKKIIVEVLVFIFIALFIYASFRKLVDLKMFVKEVWGFSIFGSKIALKWEYILLSTLELSVALLLSIPRTRIFGLYGAFFTMVVINVCSIYMLQFAKIIPIYYGGIFPVVSFDFTLCFNLIMLFLSLVALIMSYENKNKKII